MSLISDALFLEATVAAASSRRTVDATGAERTEPTGRHGAQERLDEEFDLAGVQAPHVPPRAQARAIAELIRAGRDDRSQGGRESFPGLGWLRQPETYSDREWILAIAQEYRDLDRAAPSTAE
jgi:hypothetical protein